jgi:hypothetical protein
MVTTDSEWFNEMDGEQAFPSLADDSFHDQRVPPPYPTGLRRVRMPAEGKDAGSLVGHLSTTCGWQSCAGTGAYQVAQLAPFPLHQP